VSATAWGNFKTEVCVPLCESASPIPYCQLDDPALAAAAVSAAPDELKAVRDYVQKKLEQHGLSPLAEAKLDKAPAVVKLAAEFSEEEVQTGFPFDLGSTGVSLAATALKGLAKFIEDRGKQEAVGWVLDALARDVCADKTPEQREIQRYWLPSLCTLARGNRLSSYGGGGAMLEALRAAVEDDLEHWPGTAASVIDGDLFYAEIEPGKSLLGCHDATAPASCENAHAIRTSTRERVTQILKGADALLTLSELSNELHDANAVTDESGQTKHSARLGIVACSLGLPGSLRAYNDRMGEIGNDTVRTHAAALASLVTVPACFALVGKGAETAKCAVFGGADVAGCSTHKLKSGAELTEQHKLALDGVAIEHLSTLVRLRTTVGARVDNVKTRTQALAAAIKDLGKAVDRAREAGDTVAKLPAPSLEGVKLDDAAAVADAVRAYHASAVNAIVGSAEAQVLRAGLRVAEAGVALGQESALLMRSAISKDTLPGLWKMNASTLPPPRVRSAGEPDDTKAEEARLMRLLQKRLAATIAQLDRIAALIHALQSYAEGDPAKAATTALRLVTKTVALPGIGETDLPQKPTSMLGRHLGLLAAIASAKDSDDVARALDAAAAPAGAWRGKGERWAKTVSITAHPGFFMASEWRYGTYGAIREDAAQHWQLPALALPVGLEFTLGLPNKVLSPLGAFVSFIDPAAFLQYDAEDNARLPGASIKTALAPGFAARFGIAGTPFSIMPEIVYRPGFRQWKSDFSGDGADALQLGVHLGVDVTLFGLYQSGDEP
jgi:hypothetical protein